MIRSPVPVVAMFVLVGCHDHPLAEAPPPPSAETVHAPPAVTSSATSEATVTDVADGGDSSPHVVRVTMCALDRSGCLRAQSESPPEDSSYRVAFGRGAGLIRTRGQAMAELYKEVRDRTDSGEHLAAKAHHLGDPHTPLEPRTRVAEDPLTEAAYQLMEAVDRDGEITIDSLSRQGPGTCKLSLGPLDPDAGATNCLINAPSPIFKKRER
jgi:hypothetical protein